jgi:lycopene cyclase domain-containing protein
MTYLEFLLLFVGIPLIGFFLVAHRKKRLDRLNLTGIALMGAVALIYTTPWDNYLIMRGVWSYPEGMVLGTLGYVPVEEYGFMIMQTLIAGTLWSMNLPKNNQAGLSFSAKGLLLALAIGIFGSYCLTLESGTYAGLILVWAFPPLALQWSLGARALRESLKSWVPLWVGFTLYLCLADSFAISQGIWSLTLSTRSGWELGNLPVEEALFFALTNLFVLQGLSLWRAWKISSL